MSHAVSRRDLLVVLAAILAVFTAAAVRADRAAAYNAATNCTGQSPSYSFFDDLESRTTADWPHSAAVGPDAWSYPASTFPSSGDTNLFGVNLPTTSDSSISPAAAIAVPATGTSYLRFAHKYAFEFDPSNIYDGGVVEYRIGTGSWTDVNPSMYTGTIINYAGDTNPLRGRQAFVQDNGSVQTTIAALPGSTAGQSIQLRFRIGTDAAVGAAGWSIDDVGVYQCATDTTAPQTTINTATTTFTTSTPALDFSSNEKGVGFDCRADGGPWSRCFSKRSFPVALVNGTHTIEVRATDPADNTDATPDSRSVTINAPLPDTTIGSGPADGSRIPDSKPSFLLTTTVPGASFECKVDAGAYSPCNASYTTSALSDATHTVTVRARDAAGNVDATPAARTFTVDTTPPDTFIGVFPSMTQYVADSTPTFGFATSEPPATYECALDAAPFASCSGAYTPGPLSDGPHSFQVRARDVAGNADQTPASTTFIVDTTTPDTSIADGPAAGSTVSDPTPTFSLDSAEEGVTFECSLDGTGFGACPTSYTTTPLSDGPHSVQVRAVDRAGNVDGTPVTRSFHVDTSAPDTSIGDGPGTVTADRKPTFALASPVAGATFECSLDDGAFSSCPSSYTTAALGDGGHTVRARARNAAGTVDPTPASRTFTVDTTPPDTSIVAGPDAGSTIASTTPSFELASTEDGSAFECSLDGADFASCPASFTTGVLDAGDHVAAFRARDAAGNGDPTPATRRFRVAAAQPPPPPPPVTPFALKGTPVVGATSVKLTLTVPGAGTLDVAALSGKTTLGTARAKPTRAGTLTVTLALSRAARALRSTKAVKATFTLTFKPTTGGAAQRLTKTVTLPRRR